jgi:hypothetical protein
MFILADQPNNTLVPLPAVKLVLVNFHILTKSLKHGSNGTTINSPYILLQAQWQYLHEQISESMVVHGIS